MKRYLLNVTFCAGSDAPEDTDRDLFILTVDKEISENEMIKTFEMVNFLLSPYRDDDEKWELSYDEGLNINTLMKGIELYTKGILEEVYSGCGAMMYIDNYYVIEQWQ